MKARKVLLERRGGKNGLHFCQRNASIRSVSVLRRSQSLKAGDVGEAQTICRTGLYLFKTLICKFYFLEAKNYANAMTAPQWFGTNTRTHIDTRTHSGDVFSHSLGANLCDCTAGCRECWLSTERLGVEV